MSEKSNRFLPGLLALEAREVPATLAFFNTSVLTVLGDGNVNNITVAADASGNVTVMDGTTSVAIQSTFGAATKANLKTITVFAMGGSDTVILDKTLNTLDANGKLASAPDAVLDGGAGNDTLRPLIGGFVGGVVGNAIVGNVTQYGGDGNDFLDSGFGNDVMFGGNGNDTMRWLPGTLIDTFEGGSGRDTAIIVGNGNNQGDAFVLSANPNAPGRALFQRTNLVPFFVDIGTTEVVTMQTDTGDDTITVNNLAGTGVQLVTADGGAGNDMIDASATNVFTQLSGGDGNDTLIGGKNSDLIFGGNGDDKLTGNGGLDVLSGDAGNDTLDDGVKDGKIDVLVGGSGADTFVRRQTVNTNPPQFDEFVLDANQADGDTVTVMTLTP